MNIMLVAIFAAMGVGLFAKGYEGRAWKLVLTIPVLLTLAYFVHPAYMT
jgi:hypothetical protein